MQPNNQLQELMAQVTQLSTKISSLQDQMKLTQEIQRLQDKVSQLESGKSSTSEEGGKSSSKSEENDSTLAKAVGGAGVGFSLAGLIASFVGAFGGASASTLGGAGILLVIGAVMCAYAVHQHNKKHANDPNKQIKFTKKGMGLASVIFGLFLLSVLVFANFSTGALIFAAVLVGAALVFAAAYKGTSMALNSVDKQDKSQNEQENNFNKSVFNDNNNGIKQLKETYNNIKSNNDGKLSGGIKHTVNSTKVSDLRIKSPTKQNDKELQEISVNYK